MKELLIHLGGLTWAYSEELDGFYCDQARGLRIEQRVKSLPHGYGAFEFWMVNDRADAFDSLPFKAGSEKWISLKGFRFPKASSAFLANGYQCWTESSFITKKTILKKESHDPQRYFGDDRIWNYDETPGQGHSWSFTILVAGSTESPANFFYGALTEDLGFGLFHVHLPEQTLDFLIDVEGDDFSRLHKELLSSHQSLLTALILPNPDSQGHVPLHEISAIWQDKMRSYETLPRLSHRRMNLIPPVTGYTSWYNRFTEIDEPWLLKHTETVASNTKWKVFQIDDGYQAKIGDWLEPGTGFPDGIEGVLRSASERGLIPGVWLAPFVAVWNSNLLKNHPEWLALDEGKEIVAGDFAHWGGKFFVLDHENPAYQSYMASVLEHFASLGVKFIKADFLYAAAIRPRRGKTRAQLSCEAHQWFYDLCSKNNMMFLSCGAPLSSAYGRCDFSRIGPDISLDWNFLPLLGTSSREKPSVKSSLINTVTRAILNGNAFWNDPDVVILRTENTSLTHSEKNALVHINRAFGGLLFSSDSPETYGEPEKRLLQTMEGGMSLEKIMSFSLLDDSRFYVQIQTQSGTWRIDLEESVKFDFTKG